MSNPTFWASLRCQVVSWITRISPGFGRFDTFMRRDIYRHNRNKSQYIPYLPCNLHRCALLWSDIQDIPNLRYFTGGRVAIYPESRNLFHYTALMTDPNSRGLTNSGNATICNGSTHWSITGGHLRSTLPPSLPHTYSSISSFFTNSSLASYRPKQICLLHSNLSLYGPELAFTPAFLSSKTSPLKHKSRRERQTGGHSQQHLPLPST